MASSLGSSRPTTATSEVYNSLHYTEYDVTSVKFHVNEEHVTTYTSTDIWNTSDVTNTSLVSLSTAETATGFPPLTPEKIIIGSGM